jgi:hypothetical protein
MSAKTSVALAIGVIVLSSLTGCCSPWRVTEYGTEGQPWFGPEEQAEGKYKHRRCVISFEDKYIWHGPGRTFVDAEEIVRDCRHHLAFRGLWEDPEYLGEAGSEILAGRSPQTRKAALALSMHPFAKAISVYDDTRIIVCLKPTVVLTIPMPAYVGFTRSLWQVPLGGRLPGSDSPEPFVVLPHGFDFGTRLPYHEAVMWFSPDLRVGPERPRRVSEDEMRISVPWGELVLVREDDDWVVQRERHGER